MTAVKDNDLVDIEKILRLFCRQPALNSNDFLVGALDYDRLVLPYK